MDTEQLQRYLSDFWDGEIVPALTEFIRIPNESPSFDKDWQANGHMQRAVELATAWIERQQVPGLTLKVVQDGKRTPLLLAEVPGDLPETVVLYGHLDKQPPMVGWREDLGPWTPVYEDGKLYGRGGGDDGYAVFAAIAAIKALKSAGKSHGRLVLLIECSEESGSVDLPHYLKLLAAEIGDPDLVICLDSGCGNYEQLWSTVSLRGIVGVTVTVEVLREGIHSGMAGGLVPNPTMIMRQLLDRLEDSRTGRLVPESLHAEIPEQRVEQARHTAHVLGGSVSGVLPFVEGVHPLSDDTVELLLAGTWRPALAVIGAGGLPAPGDGGNVLIPKLTWRLSLRTPPTVDTSQAAATVRELLQKDPPFGAKVTVSAGGEPGWNAPPLAPWLEDAAEAASQEFYGKEACYFGIGGSIPFMHMIGQRWPEAQFLITGVLGPNSNAHGPNEFLHVPYAKQLTCCLVRVLAAHHAHRAGN